MASPYENAALLRAFDGVLRPGGLALTRGLIDACGLAPGSRALDVGCGAGRGARLLQERGYRAVGMDVSSALLGEARRYAAGGVPPDPPSARPLLVRPLLVRADAAGFLPFRDQAFDAVFSECVLSLLPDPAGALAECRRVLRPGGRLALSDVYFKGGAAGPPAAPGGTAGLRTALERAGFVVQGEEDHSRALGEFAARLIWETGSTDALRDLLCGCGGAKAPAGGGPSGGMGGGRRPQMGYVAIVAVKGL